MNEVSTAAPATLNLAAALAAAPVLSVHQAQRQNGVTMPPKNTKTGAVWQAADFVFELRKTQGLKHTVPIVSEVVQVYSKMVPDASNSTCRQHFGEYIKFHALKDAWQARIDDEKPVEDDDKAIKAKERADKAAARTAARIVKLTADIADLKKSFTETFTKRSEADAKRIAERAEHDKKMAERYEALNKKLADLQAGKDTDETTESTAADETVDGTTEPTAAETVTETPAEAGEAPAEAQVEVPVHVAARRKSGG